MSEEDFNDDSEGIKSLRKAYKDAQKQNEELLQELNQFRAQQRQSSVADILKAKGLPASAARLYVGEDTSEDAVGKWIDEFADVFNVQSSSEQNDANAQNAQRVSAASGGIVDGPQAPAPGQPVPGNTEEMLNALRTLPFEELERLGYMPKTGNLFNPKR